MPRFLHNRSSAEAGKKGIPVDQLVKMITAVAVFTNADKVPFESVILADGPDEGIYSVDPEAFVDDTNALSNLCVEAANKTGKLTIRFLGDLKEQNYPLDTILFNATKDDDHNLDLTRTIQNALLKSGGKEVRMVNLANVRDIVIVPGNPDPLINAQIKYVIDMVALFRQWIQSGGEIIVEKK